MKIVTKTTELTNAVVISSKYTGKDGSFAGQITLVGQDGNLAIKSSDFIETVIFKNIRFTSSDLTNANFDSISVDVKKLSQALKTCKTEDVEIDFGKEDQITLKSGKSKFKISTTAEIQPFPISTEGVTVNLDQKFIESLKIVHHSVDSANPRYELNSCCIKSEEGVLTAVGTNTRVLAIARQDIGIDFNEALLPKSAMKSLIDLFAGQSSSALINETTLSVETDKIYYSTKLTTGKFVDWQRIVPKSYKTVIKLPKDLLESLFKEVCIFNASQVKVEIENGKIRLMDKEGEASIEEELEGVSETLPIFYLCGAYILNMLGALTRAKNIEFCFNDTNLPFVIKVGDSFQEIIMPIIVDVETQTEQEAA